MGLNWTFGVGVYVLGFRVKVTILIGPAGCAKRFEFLSDRFAHIFVVSNRAKLTVMDATQKRSAASTGRLFNTT